ncbi:MAG: hypothetical protein RMA76_03980 [Deltaproteobacteria bacterium]|jgi:hypothetical protein
MKVRVLAFLVLGACAHDPLRAADDAFDRGDYVDAIVHYRRFEYQTRKQQLPWGQRGHVDERLVASWTALLEPTFQRIEELLADGRPMHAFDLAWRITPHRLLLLPPDRYLPPPEARAWDARVRDLLRRAGYEAVGANDPDRDVEEIAARWWSIRREFKMLPTGLTTPMNTYVDGRIAEEMAMLATGGEPEAALQLATDLGGLMKSPSRLRSVCHEAGLYLRGEEGDEVKRLHRQEHHLEIAHDLQQRMPRLAFLHAQAGQLWAAANGRDLRLPPIVIRENVPPSAQPPIRVRSIAGCKEASKLESTLRRLIERKGTGKPFHVDVELTSCRWDERRRTTSRETTFDYDTTVAETELVPVWETYVEPKCRTVTACRHPFEKTHAWGNTYRYCRENDTYETVSCVDQTYRRQVMRPKKVHRKKTQKIRTTQWASFYNADIAVEGVAKIAGNGEVVTVDAKGKGTGAWGGYDSVRQIDAKIARGVGVSAAISRALSPLVTKVRGAVFREAQRGRATWDANKDKTAQELVARAASLRAEGKDDEAFEAQLVAFQDFGAKPTKEDFARFDARLDTPDEPRVRFVERERDGSLNVRLRNLRLASEKTYHCPNPQRPQALIRAHSKVAFGNGEKPGFGSSEWADEIERRLYTWELYDPPEHLLKVDRETAIELAKKRSRGRISR